MSALDKKVRRISNPLTIIAMFAAIAEIAATVSLATVDDPETRRIFIWFVMGFPTGLVVLFFLTLNFNSKVLYAPSDFKDERHFMILNSYKRRMYAELDRVVADLGLHKAEDSRTGETVLVRRDESTPGETRTISSPYFGFAVGDIQRAYALVDRAENLGDLLDIDPYSLGKQAEDLLTGLDETDREVSRTLAKIEKIEKGEL